MDLCIKFQPIRKRIRKGNDKVSFLNLGQAQEVTFSKKFEEKRQKFAERKPAFSKNNKVGHNFYSM